MSLRSLCPVPHVRYREIESLSAARWSSGSTFSEENLSMFLGCAGVKFVIQN